MSAAQPARDTGDLPAPLPIFPLSGVLLLPKGRLPLHIFEPRYRAMTRDALAGPGVIGMIQPLDADEGGAQPRVYGVGCAGRITGCRMTADGRYYYTLIGLCRFTIVEELPLHDGYRRVTPDWHRFPADRGDESDSIVDRPRLVETLRRYSAAHGIAVDWAAIESAPSAGMVTSLAMLCPFAPSEKQVLLEAPDLAERSRVLTALLEMDVTGTNGAGRPRAH